MTLPSPTQHRNLTEFTQRCIIQDALIGTRFTLDSLQGSTNIWKDIQENANPALGMSWKEGNSTQFLTCTAAAHKFQALLMAQYTQLPQKTFSTLPQITSAYNLSLIHI